MAVTLPYPNMDFTPLDVLTAAEMDQMVANDKYLADFCAGLADGTNIGNGMIQARKLNWSSLIDKNIQYGTNNGTFYPSGTPTTTTITFPHPFNNAPAVMVIPRSVAQNGASLYGEIYVATIRSISNAQAVITLRTNYHNSVNAKYDWLAIGD